MNIKEILTKLLNGELTVNEAENQLKLGFIAELEDMAKLDLNRDLRRGIPEIVYGEGKTAEQIIEIVKEALKNRDSIIISRIATPKLNALKNAVDGVEMKINEAAKMVIVKKQGTTITKIGRKIGILTAGTADIPVAEEARMVLEELGCEVICEYDVGIAGIHRLLPPLKKMMKESVDALIVVAGMEGALPTVVSGLVDVPVIGVPTSTGYGVGGEGLAALLSMLQSCALGLTIVNIDNGVSAAAAAFLIAKRVAAASELK
ncbi:MAG: nickel pincer cofactor biosynthesis protein LarB [Candidatus Odinarchaeia archaeon]